MPKIKKVEKQERALVEITEALSEVEAVNEALTGKRTFVLMLQAEGKGKKNEIRVNIEERDMAKLLAIVSVRKARLAKVIRSKADKFGIELSEEELTSLEPVAEEIPAEQN